MHVTVCFQPSQADRRTASLVYVNIRSLASTVSRGHPSLVSLLQHWILLPKKNPWLGIDLQVADFFKNDGLWMYYKFWLVLCKLSRTVICFPSPHFDSNFYFEAQSNRNITSCLLSFHVPWYYSTNKKVREFFCSLTVPVVEENIK